MRHFTSTQDWTIGELQALLDQAAGLRSDPVRPLLQGRTVALLFLNRSLRTRASFQIGAAQLGATAIVLEPGNGVWGIERQGRGAYHRGRRSAVALLRPHRDARIPRLQELAVRP